METLLLLYYYTIIHTHIRFETKPEMFLGLKIEDLIVDNNHHHHHHHQFHYHQTIQNQGAGKKELSPSPSINFSILIIPPSSDY